MSTIVNLQRVLALCDPRKNWPWDCEEPTPGELEQMLLSAPEMPHPVPPGSDAKAHVGRIRYLAKTGWNDTIEMDLGVPCLGYSGPAWPVLDGNHRLWAAALRGNDTIAVDVAGQVDYAAELLGVAEADILGDREEA